MVFPAVYTAIYWDKYNYSDYQALILVILPIIFLNYIYYSKMVSPVGFQDLHSGIFQYFTLFTANGHIDFSKAQTISFSFVSLYTLFKLTSLFTGIDIILLSTIFPPFLNILTTIFVFLISKRFFSPRLALLTTLFFGWENQILVFGTEFRTQTLGTLLFFILIFLLMFTDDLKDERKKWGSILVLIILFAITTTSFVNTMLTFIFLVSVLISIMFFKYIKKIELKSPSVTVNLTILLTIFFAFYLFYIGTSFDKILPSTINLIVGTFSGEEIGAVITPSKPLYGNFVLYVQRLFLILTAIFSILLIKDLINNPNVNKASILGGLFSLVGYWFLVYVIGGPLSISRIYIVAFIIFSIAISYGLLKMPTFKNPIFKNQIVNKHIPILIVFLFVLSSVLQFPGYIVGETGPLRNNEPIDGIYYWDADLPQYAACNFLKNTNNITIRTDMLLRNYQFLNVSKNNDLRMVEGLNHQNMLFKKDDLILLHDKFRGENYTYRDSFAKSSEYELFNKIYSNEDYNIYSYL